MAVDHAGTDDHQDAGQVAFDVSHEDRYAGGAEAFGHDLQGNGLARARGPGDEAVAVGHLGEEEEIFIAFGDEESGGVAHGHSFHPFYILILFRIKDLN